MDKNIKKVRKGIEDRKKERTSPEQINRLSQLDSTLPQNEEKHGYLPLFTGDQSKTGSKDKQPSASRFLLKGILALMLFLSAALVMDGESDRLSAPKQWTSTALSHEFPFAKVNQWYQETLGSPLAFEPNQDKATQGSALPAAGEVVETFQTHGSGIVLAPKEATNVAAVKPGIVIFAGNDKETGKTVVVQHPDNSLSTYGQLSDIDVHVYQSVTANEQMGGFEPSEAVQGFYFAIEKNNEPIDPVQVIQVDDRS